MKKSVFAVMSLIGVLGCSGNGEFTAAPETPDAQTDASDADKETGMDAATDRVDADSGTPDAADAASVQDGSEAEAAASDASDAQTIPETSVPLVPGDLIKGATSGIHYYGEDYKRHLFPNENTFYSWLTADDFNLAKTLPDAELTSLPAGKDVTIRPGTYLVKIQSDPKSYALTNCGQLHWIESEAITLALYGANWANKIVDVPESIFGQYTQSTPITAPVHPDGQVIAYAGDTNRYVVMGGVKRKIASTAAFNANKWQESFVVTTAVPYGDGPDVTNAEPENFWHIVCQ